MDHHRPPDAADKRVSAVLTPNEARRLLSLMATDDDFRAEFERDPAAVLARHHIHLQFSFDSTPHRKLPSKEDLQALLEAMDGGTEFCTIPTAGAAPAMAILGFSYFSFDPYGRECENGD